MLSKNYLKFVEKGKPLWFNASKSATQLWVAFSVFLSFLSIVCLCRFDWTRSGNLYFAVYLGLYAQWLWCGFFRTALWASATATQNWWNCQFWAFFYAKKTRLKYTSAIMSHKYLYRSNKHGSFPLLRGHKHWEISFSNIVYKLLSFLYSWITSKKPTDYRDK